MGWRWVGGLLLGLVVFLGVLGVARPAGAAQGDVPTPSSESVQPIPGGLAVSWTQLAQAGVTYNVASTPAGLSCSVVDGSSCTFSVQNRTPWQFSVSATETNGGVTVSSAPSALTSPAPTRLVLVVAGQSNAVGWLSYPIDPATGANYLSAPFANGADTNDLLTWLWGTSPVNGLVGLDTPQIVEEYSPVQVFGPEIGLARKVWTDTSQPVTIVKAALSGSFLASVANAPSWDPRIAGGTYQTMIDAVQGVLASDAQSGQLDVIGGFYWYQGESDADYANTAAAYQSNLVRLLTKVRKDLPMKKAPIALAKESSSASVAAQLAAGTISGKQASQALRSDAEVRAADDWVTNHEPHVVEVDTLDLARGSDSLHLTAPSELKLGSRLAKATESLFP